MRIKITWRGQEFNVDSGKFNDEDEVKEWAKKQWAATQGHGYAPIFCHEGRIEHVDVEYVAAAPLLELTTVKRKYAVRLDPQFAVREVI